MEPQTVLQTASQSEVRAPYAPPAASFVPLKLEERLAGCEKVDNTDCLGVPHAGS
jgi:hypothetical protein